MFAVEVYAAVRHFVLIKENSQRDVARMFGLSRGTVAKMCGFSDPPGYTRVKPVAKGRRSELHAPDARQYAAGSTGMGKSHVALALGSPLARRASPSPSRPRMRLTVLPTSVCVGHILEENAGLFGLL